MRITYRAEDTRAYWQRRWERIPADEPIENASVYPIKYAEMTIASKAGRILEAGCGNGRILRFYKNRGYDIIGMDYVSSGLRKLQQADPQLSLQLGDIRELAFQDESFRFVLAFGLYHNLDHGDLERALGETLRVLQPGGRLCASYRADNVHNFLIDRLTERNDEGGNTEAARKFHKMNLTRAELVEIFQRVGFRVESVHSVENMPLLYKFAPFRARTHRTFDESRGRREGYCLSLPGFLLQKTLFRLFPNQVCNVFVLIACKP